VGRWDEIREVEAYPYGAMFQDVGVAGAVVSAIFRERGVGGE
jgi:hypothetical protein